jgi:Methylamine utilisation protein MauE
MSLISLLAGSILIVVFGWGALAKLVRFPQWQNALAVYRLVPQVAAIALFGVPLSEMVIVGLLVSSHARAGAALSLGLIAAFSWALLRARQWQGDRLPCGCFGRAELHDYRLLVGRNAGIAVLAGVVLIQGHDHLMTESLRWSPSSLLPSALVIIGLLLALWVAREFIQGMRKQ